MQVLPLCKKICPNITSYLGKELGTGSDGQVFDLLKFNNKRVIKLCVLFDSYDKESPQSSYDKTDCVLRFIKDKKPITCARVYEHGYFGKGSRKTHFNEQGFLLYYYVMEKMQKISEDEKRVFHTILSHEDRGIVKNFSNKKLEEVLVGLHKGLDFDERKVMLFYNNLKNSSVRQLDMHVRNIMKNNNGKFKMIDFDRMEII